MKRSIISFAVFALAVPAVAQEDFNVGTVTFGLQQRDVNSEDLRRRLHMEYANRGYPKNMAVLDSMLSKRWQIAKLLGFAHWADFITADKMVGSSRNASEFLVLDAKDIGRGPVASVALPQRVPFGFHGAWFAD